MFWYILTIAILMFCFFLLGLIVILFRKTEKQQEEILLIDNKIITSIRIRTMEIKSLDKKINKRLSNE